METARTLSRANKAMQIERRTYRTWTPARIGIRIPSQRLAGVTYNTSLDGCSCPDHTFRLIACKHMLAARIFMGRNAA
jgi:hypothetical protein